jgi:hypothetical protein
MTLPLSFFFFVSAAQLYQPGEVEARQFKNLFVAGESAYSQGDYGLAIYFFKRAERTKMTPEVAYDLAKCFEKIDDEPTATYFLRLYLKRAGAAAADRAEVENQVARFLSKARASGFGLVEIEAPFASAIRFSKRWWPEAPVAFLAPAGTHRLDIVTSESTLTQTIEVESGAAATRNAGLTTPPLVSSEAVPLPAAVLQRPPAARPRSGLRTASFVTGGLGLAALVTGGVLGLSARSDASISQDRQLTFVDAQSAADRANGKGLAANVLWGAGAAALAGGVLMFALSGSETKASEVQP